MKKNIKVGSDFSGVGAFDYAIKRIAERKNLNIETIYACDWDKYARITYQAAHGTPKYYPKDVYEREIPKDFLDIYMTSPPCFVGNTLVNTQDGFKEIKDINIGDFVLTHQNRFRQVTDFGFKQSEIYSLKAQGIIETETTSNHRYYVRKRYRKWDNELRKDVRKFTDPEWIEVSDLTKDHFIGINIPLIEENVFEITKDIAYVLGRYVADGWLRIRDNDGKTKGNSIVIAVGKGKIETISEKIRIKHSIEKEVRGSHKLFIYSNELVSLIQRIGLGRGAENKRIPQSIINLPKDILIEFFNGYMDGDGHTHKNAFRATSISKELLMGLQLCVAKLFKSNSNIKHIKTPDTTVIEGRTVNQKDYYVLEFRKEMKKQSNAILIDDVIWCPIRSIEKTNKIETVYDITVEEDHSFTANQAIVHNCQAFSLAGKRLGKEDKRGILFFNSHEFIQKNKPRFFIFENVKGLLSDDSGKTFSEWVNMLGGKSVNGIPVLFPYEDSVPYHLYWKVLNAKHHGVPQNRERVFLIGIRDDQDNVFQFPKEEHLTKRLKDVLENDVDDKYFLSEKAISHLSVHKEKHDEKGTGFGVELKDENSIASTLRANGALCPTDNHLKIDLKKYYLSDQRKKTIENSDRFIGWTDPEKKESSNCIISSYYKQPTDGEYLKIKSATSKGYEEAKEGDSINFSVPNSETRRGRVGKGVAQTLDTACNQGVMVSNKVIIHNIPEIVKVRKHEVRIAELQNLLKAHKKIPLKEIAAKLNVPKTKVEHWFRKDQYFAIPEAELWFDLKEILQIKTTEFDLEITEFEERESVFEKSNRVYDENGNAPTMTSTSADERILVSKEDPKIGTWRTHKDGQGFREIEDGNCPTIPARAREDGSGQPVILVSKEVRTEESKKKRKETGTNDFRGKQIEFREQDSMNTITTSLTNDHYLKSDYKIRRLTPIEAFRLMDFPDEIVHKAREQGMSDSQLYKQAGNSIVVRVLEKILDRLPL